MRHHGQDALIQTKASKQKHVQIVSGELQRAPVRACGRSAAGFSGHKMYKNEPAIPIGTRMPFEELVEGPFRARRRAIELTKTVRTSIP